MIGWDAVECEQVVLYFRQMIGPCYDTIVH